MLAFLATACAASLLVVSVPVVRDWWVLRERAVTTEGTVVSVRDGARGDHVRIEYRPPGAATPTRADVLVRDGTPARPGSSMRFRFDPSKHSNVAPVGYDARIEFALLMVLVLGLLLGVCANEARRMGRREIVLA